MTQDEHSGKAAGGYARAAALTPARRSEIAKAAGQAKGKDGLSKATHFGFLHIAGIEMPCANLNTGERVLTQSGFMKALGRARQAKGRQYYDGDVNLPAFLTAKNLKPFIGPELEVTSSQIEFRLNGKKAFGYRAELLPKVCSVFINAHFAGALTAIQEHVAERARILYDGLAEVGIAALIDEATGYQEVRDRLALQKILDAYLRKEYAAWAKRFPDEFYYGIFRLHGWQWKGMKVNRPQIVAHYTTDIVYNRLAPGITEELQRLNPVENGRRRAKHHQWLTEDIGCPALVQHLVSVITLMRVAQSWSHFMAMLEIAHPKKGDTQLFDFMKDQVPNLSDAATEPEPPSSQAPDALQPKEIQPALSRP